jgi:hypothetical protein
MRIKRQNQTYFITCNPTDTIRSVKQQISLAAKGETPSDSMRLLLTNKDRTVLENDKTLAKYDIKSEDQLYVVFQMSENEWEPVQVVEDPTAVSGDS